MLIGQSERSSVVFKLFIMTEFSDAAYLLFINTELESISRKHSTRVLWARIPLAFQFRDSVRRVCNSCSNFCRTQGGSATIRIVEHSENKRLIRGVDGSA